MMRAGTDLLLDRIIVKTRHERFTKRQKTIHLGPRNDLHAENNIVFPAFRMGFSNFWAGIDRHQGPLVHQPRGLQRASK